MSCMFDEEFDDDFLRELDRIEMSQVESGREAGNQFKLDSIDTSAASMPGGIAAYQQGALTHQSTVKDTIFSSSDKVVEHGHPGFGHDGGCNNDCNASMNSKLGTSSTYRWTVHTICVRDGNTGVQEVVGKGMLIIDAREEERGALGILKTVITTAGGSRAMDIPRAAISFLEDSDREGAIPSPEQDPSTTPTLLLGLGIGCTIVMRGVQPAEEHEESVIYSGKGEGAGQLQTHGPLNIASKAAAERMQAPPATPERRRLAPEEFISPSEGDGKARARSDEVQECVTVVHQHPNCEAGRRRLDPILTKIVDTMSSSLVHEARCMSEMNGDVNHSVVAPTTECGEDNKNTERDEQPLLDELTSPSEGTSKEDNHTARAQEVPSKDAKGRNGEDRGCSPASGDVVNGDFDVKKEADIADDEWRMPLVTSPNRRRAGRRLPAVRRIPCSGPVILAALDESSEEQAGVKTPTGESRVGAPGGIRRKQPRPVDMTNLGEQRSCQKRHPGLIQCSPGTEDSWLKLRRILHERYRDFEEREAAEESSAGARCMEDSIMKSTYGKILSQGLWMFRRQEHAFAYADAMESRLAPRDAARYKVLSYETNSTGSRKFLVCDFKRFEEQYPFVANADRDVLKYLSPQSTADSRIPQTASSRESTMIVDRPDTQALAATPRVSCEGTGGESGDEVFVYRSSLRLHISSAPGHPYSPLGHVYEIIREGYPCRMYFDLEFPCAQNVGLDGELLVRAWINVVAGKLQQDFSISVGRSNFLDLDSSTPKKFSRHLILHLPGDQLFQDNSHIGRFVNSLAQELEAFRRKPGIDGPEELLDSNEENPPSNGPVRAKTGKHLRSPLAEQASSPQSELAPTAAHEAHGITPDASILTQQGDSGKGSDKDLGMSTASHGLEPEDVVPITAPGDLKGGKDNIPREWSRALESLWVYDSDGQAVLFADVSVYTRNRCFRLPGSSKFGKTAVLKLAATNARTLEHMDWRGGSQRDPRDVARTILHESLVVPAELRPKGEVYLTVEGGGPHRYSRYRTNRGEHSRVGWGASGAGRSHATASAGTSGATGTNIGDIAASRCGWQGKDEEWRVESSGFGPSPFPAVDDFLRTLIRCGGVRGDLRHWNYVACERKGGKQFDGSSGRPGSNPGAPVISRLLTHQVANNRWCYNIGRAHKSNHVFLVTDISRGEVRQHCHDQNCRRSGYRSNPIPLPAGLIPSRDDLEVYDLELGIAAAMHESPAEWASVA